MTAISAICSPKNKFISSAAETAARTASGDFAVIAHGGIIACFLEKITGSRYKPDYTEVISLIWDNGQFFSKDAL